jgi:hypothetical protein
VEKDPSLVDNPISQTVDLQAYRQSDDPAVRSNVEIMERLNGLQNEVSSMARLLHNFANASFQPIPTFPALSPSIPITMVGHPAYRSNAGRIEFATMPPIEGMVQAGPEEENKPPFMK